MRELLIATRNPGKFAEISAFLKERHPFLRCLSLESVKNIPEIEENGSSFLENATKKAKITASFAKLPALADDSGLEVEALGGRPGVLSARFGGPQATDEQNVQKLLEKLQGVPLENRSARFRCVMVLYSPTGTSFTAKGDLAGRIMEAPRGVNGFGYDPVFALTGSDRSLAEISIDEKNRISHRAQALTKISAALDEFLKNN